MINLDRYESLVLEWYVFMKRPSGDIRDLLGRFMERRVDAGK